MEFEELSNIWNKSDLELEESVEFNKELVKRVGVNKIKSGLYEIKWEAIIEIVVGIFFFKFLGGFIFEHFTEIKFLIPALFLFNLTLFGVLTEGFRLYLYYSISPNDPVLKVQQKLARLRYMEFVEIYSLLVIIPLFSAPFFIVIAKAFLHISLYEFNLSWLISYTAGSVVIALILVIVLRLFPNKNLTNAIAFMKDLKENKSDD